VTLEQKNIEKHSYIHLQLYQHIITAPFLFTHTTGVLINGHETGIMFLNEQFSIKRYVTGLVAIHMANVFCGYNVEVFNF